MSSVPYAFFGDTEFIRRAKGVRFARSHEPGEGVSLVGMNTDETQALDELADRLRVKFPEAPLGSIRKAVSEVHHQYDGRPIRDFIPVLVEREVRDHLSADQRQHAGASS